MSLKSTEDLQNDRRIDLTQNDEWITNKKLLDLMIDNFKLKYNKDPYEFSGVSVAMIFEGGTMRYGWTPEEADILEMNTVKNRLEGIASKMEREAKYAKVKKYLSKQGITEQDLADMYPDLELSDDYYDDYD